MAASPTTCALSVKWIESEDLMDDDYESRLRDFDAILVPGGFGKRGIAGMIRAITYARKSAHALFRHLSGNADRLYRVCAQCLRSEGCRLD